MHVILITIGTRVPLVVKGFYAYGKSELQHRVILKIVSILVKNSRVWRKTPNKQTNKKLYVWYIWDDQTIHEIENNKYLKTPLTFINITDVHLTYVFSK